MRDDDLLGACFDPHTPTVPGLYLARFGDRTPEESRVSAPWLGLIEYRHYPVRPDSGIDYVLDAKNAFGKVPRWLSPIKVEFAQAVMGEVVEGITWAPFVPPASGWVEWPEAPGHYVMRGQANHGPWYDLVVLGKDGRVVNQVMAVEVGRGSNTLDGHIKRAFAPLVIPCVSVEPPKLTGDFDDVDRIVVGHRIHLELPIERLGCVKIVRTIEVAVTGASVDSVDLDWIKVPRSGLRWMPGCLGWFRVRAEHADAVAAFIPRARVKLEAQELVKTPDGRMGWRSFPSGPEGEQAGNKAILASLAGANASAPERDTFVDDGSARGQILTLALMLHNSISGSFKPDADAIEDAAARLRLSLANWVPSPWAFGAKTRELAEIALREHESGQIEVIAGAEHDETPCPLCQGKGCADCYGTGYDHGGKASE